LKFEVQEDAFMKKDQGLEGVTVDGTLHYEVTDGSNMAVGVGQRHQNKSLLKNSVVL
jgi:hypothetical protein